MFKFSTGLVSALVAAVTLLFAAQAMAQSNYMIRPGDTLRVEVLEDPELNRNVLVLPDGSISFPLTGSLQASGRSVDQLRSALSGALASNFANAPNVFVSVAGLASDEAALEGPTMDVFAMGEVANAGRLEVLPGTTLLQGLAQAGGFTRFAATRRIELRRVDGSVYIFDYRRNKGIPGTTVLAEGDVIVVPERGLFE